MNEKIKKLEEEIESYKNFIDLNKTQKIGTNMIDLFRKKYKEQKIKNKKEEYKYLLCIEEQEKKINSLENELKKKEKDNLPKETIRSVRCFPNFHQYDVKEDINPKSIPLFQQFQKDKKIDKYSQKEIMKTPKNFNTINHRRVLFDSGSHDRTKLILTNSDFQNIKKNSTIIKMDKSLSIKKIKNYYNNYRKSKNKIVNTDSNIIYNNAEKTPKKINEIIKEYHPKTILDNKKEFFIAHPTLNIAGIVKNKESRYVGLPNKIIRLKVHKNMEKNMIITFPSSLNETLVNLEKLRKCKNMNSVNNEKK